MEKITLLIVDDHPMMRDALQTALTQEPDLEVIGEAIDGLEGVSLYKKLRPAVVLMDLLLPGISGIAAIEQILAIDADARILVLTSLEDREHILAAVQAGALGYFPKTAPRPYLIEAIHKVADGLTYMPAGIAVKLFQTLRTMKSSPADGSPSRPLTQRQQQIIVLLGEGRSDAEIAAVMNVEEATVRAHLHNIIQRLGLENRAQLAAYANRQIT